MGAYAWYYYAGTGTYYWTEAFNMSTTQFAREISGLVGKSLGPSDISEARSRSDLDSVKRRALEMIYIP